MNNLQRLVIVLSVALFQQIQRQPSEFFRKLFQLGRNLQLVQVIVGSFPGQRFVEFAGDQSLQARFTDCKKWRCVVNKSMIGDTIRGPDDQQIDNNSIAK